MVANSMEGLVKNVPTVLRSPSRPMVIPSASSVMTKPALHNWGCSWGLNPPVSRSARVM